MPPNKQAALLLAALLAMTCRAPAEAENPQGSPENPSPPAKPGPATAPAPKPTAQRIRQWVKDMDDDSSRVRDRAVRNLIRAGQAAIAPVAEAAKGTSLEVTFRAVEVLQNLLKSEDAPTKEAAKAALKKLDDGGDHEAARQARRVLQAAEPRPSRQPARRGGAVRIAGRANVAARAQPAARRNAMANIALRLWVVDLNGNLNVTVLDKGKQIRIQENKAQITVTVTDVAAGRGQQQKQYRAANAAELKKKHPDAHKLYQKYCGTDKAKALVIERTAAVRATALIAEAEKELVQSMAELKAAGQTKMDAKHVQELLKRMEAANKKLAEARKHLGK